MWTKQQALVVVKKDGIIEILPMRYNASHQRGWRCFLGPLADRPEQISEDSAPSFQGPSLFDALAVYRGMIEPTGGRLLQAMASRDCWAADDTVDRFCRRYRAGSADTDLIDGFLPITPAEAASLEEQRASYDKWRTSLSDPNVSRAVSRPPARHALARLNSAIRAARQANILARGDLARDDPEDV